MPVSSEIVVVGAGSVGANVTYRLAQRGARVTLLDAGAPGAGTSSSSFAWLNAFRKTPRVYFDLNVASMAEHAALADELGALTGRGGWHHRHGGLHWEDTPGAQAELRANAERLESWGYPIELISPEAASELEPDLAIGPSVQEVVHTPSEGYVEMVVLIGALLDGARRHGAAIRGNTRVTRLLREGDRVVGVETAAGERIGADVVVDCAGPAADEVIRLAGAELPFGRVPGRLVYTSPVATTLRRPIHGPGGHFRPDGGGRIVLSDGNHDATYRDDTTHTPEESLAAVAKLLRPLAGARVEATRVGIRPMPTDEKPMVGTVPGLDGFYVAVSHSGVTLGPLWGRIVAAELLDGVTDARLETFRPGRFVTSGQ
jgi:glycine/D-amino acid oxidase-like deaminating enzyme